MDLFATNDNIGAILTALQATDDNIVIGADTETSGLDVRSGRDYLMGFCFDTPDMGCYIPFRHKDENVDKRFIDPLWQIIKKKKLTWHNLKFDFHSMRTLGLDPLELEGWQDDTVLMATLDNEELFSKELDFLSKIYLKDKKYEKDAIIEYGKAVGFKNVPARMYERYGPVDARLARRLREFLWPRIVAQELETVYRETEIPFAKLLYKLEQRGVGYKPDFCEAKSERGRGRMVTLQRELGFNPGSSAQVGSYLINELGLPVFKHTKSCDACKNGSPVSEHQGPPSFDKQAMADYEDVLALQNNASAQHILEYRGWQKAVTSLYEPMLEKAGPDGRIRTNFFQHRTVTGRLSSTDPNLQQIPRHTAQVWNGDAKSAFVSWIDDYLQFGWDWSQIELRLGAAYGPEPILITEFENPKADPFSVLAPRIFGKLTEDTRHWTKNKLVYPSLYGAGLAKVAAGLGMSVDQAGPIYARYKATIPNMTARALQVQALIEQRGFIKYWDGRRRHFRDRRDAFKGWNSVLQGGSAQLMKKAMLRCQEWENEECFMVLTVHDEITFLIRKDLIPKYEPLVKEAMCDWDFGVKLAIEGKEWK